MISSYDLVDGFHELLKLLDDQDNFIKKAKYSEKDKKVLLGNNRVKRDLLKAMIKRFL